jgi:hypothetical protein
MRRLLCLFLLLAGLAVGTALPAVAGAEETTTTTTTTTTPKPPKIVDAKAWSIKRRTDLGVLFEIETRHTTLLYVRYHGVRVKASRTEKASDGTRTFHARFYQGQPRVGDYATFWVKAIRQATGASLTHKYTRRIRRLY